MYAEEDYDRRKETSQRIVQSKVYRLASPFIKFFGGLSRFFAKIAAFFGPERLADKEENYGNIQRFVIDAQDAPFINKLTKLFNFIKK